MKLLSIIYYLGIIVCGIQGSKKSCQHHKGFCLPASFLAAMGGGIIRDLFILFVFPAAFTMDCILDVTLALCAGIIYRVFLQKYELQNVFKKTVILTDALGIGTFITLGVNKAFSLGATQETALCCGIVTALGGGILSALLCGQSIHEILTTNILYRIITVLGTDLYIFCLTLNINPIVAQYLLILYTFIFIPMTSYDYRKILTNFIVILIQPKTTVILIPATAVLYQQNAFASHIPNQSSLSYFSSSYTRSRNLYYMNLDHASNFKLRCPRRFAKDR